MIHYSHIYHIDRGDVKVTHIAAFTQQRRQGMAAFDGPSPGLALLRGLAPFEVIGEVPRVDVYMSIIAYGYDLRDNLVQEVAIM